MGNVLPGSPDWHRSTEEPNLASLPPPPATTVDTTNPVAVLAEHQLLLLDVLTRFASSAVGAVAAPAPNIETLSQRVAALEEKLAHPAVTLRICDLDPQPASLLRPIEVLFEPDEDGEVIASWIDAGIAVSGATRTEALHDLKEEILDNYRRLAELGPGRLGPRLRRQLKVLQAHVQPEVTW